MMPLPFALTIALAAGSAATPDCAANARNLLAKSDCGFRVGTRGWTATDGATLAHDAKDGAPGPGALVATSGPANNVQAYSPCLAAAPDTTYRFGARYRVARGEVYVCGAQVHHFSDAACQNALGPLSATADLGKPTWQAFDPKRRPENGPNQDKATTTAETRALQLVLVCSGAGPFTAHFDDVFVERP